MTTNKKQIKSWLVILLTGILFLSGCNLFGNGGISGDGNVNISLIIPYDFDSDRLTVSLTNDQVFTEEIDVTGTRVNVEFEDVTSGPWRVDILDYDNEQIGRKLITVIGGKTNYVTIDLATMDYPDPVNNPESKYMLQGNWFTHPHFIDFDNLPKVPSEHVVVSDVKAENGVNQHGYLHYYEGKFWAMWSDGPGVEDQVGQRVAYATSDDGLNWSEKQYITDYPPESGPDSPHYGTRTTAGYRYISRGFWEREGELLALVSFDEAGGFFGDSLKLLAYQWDPSAESWEEKGVVYEDAINNFQPKTLPTGDWMMSRRDKNFNVSFLVGGVDSFDDWEAHTVRDQSGNQVRFDEPHWEILPDGNLVALFRDRASGGYIYRAFSIDNGQTWSTPVQTNFPDATSKFVNLRLSDGRYVLVSNPNPNRRDPITISISDDGLTYDRMFYLEGGRHVDYPHIIEVDGYLYVQHTGGKQSIEVHRIAISDLDDMEMPEESGDYIIPDPINSSVTAVDNGDGTATFEMVAMDVDGEPVTGLDMTDISLRWVGYHAIRLSELPSTVNCYDVVEFMADEPLEGHYSWRYIREPSSLPHEHEDGLDCLVYGVVVEGNITTADGAFKIEDPEEHYLD